MIRTESVVLTPPAPVATRRERVAGSLEGSPGSSAVQALVPAVAEAEAAEKTRDHFRFTDASALHGAEAIAASMNRTLRFVKDEDTGQIAAEIVDRKSGEVIRQIPPPEMIRLAARMAEAMQIMFGGQDGSATEKIPAKG